MEEFEFDIDPINEQEMINRAMENGYKVLSQQITVDDLLFSPTLSLYLGIPAYPVANIGKTETKGYELSLSYGDEIAKNVSFNTTFNQQTCYKNWW